MQRNLALAPTKQHPEESQQIKDAVYEWREQDPRTRPTQEELARKLCDLLGRDKLSKQYINRLVNGLPPRHSEPPLNRHSSCSSGGIRGPGATKASATLASA